MDSGWQRETRVCSTIDVEPDLLAAIRAHVELYELGAVEAQALVCFVNRSRRTKRASRMERRGGADHNEMTQAVLVTPTRLVWAQRSDKSAAASATSELLATLQLTDYEKGPAFALIPDHGVEVSGIHSSEGRVGSLFFGMGEGPDADKARAILKAAARAARGEGPPVGEAATLGDQADAPSAEAGE